MQFRAVLACLFCSGALTFIFPLLLLLLNEAGFMPAHAAYIQSAALLLSALIVPQAGIALDSHKVLPVFGLASLGILLGALALLTPGIKNSLIVIVGTVSFVVGMATINMGAKRLTEGLANREQFSKAASWTYLVENAAVGIASIVGFFLIERYKIELIALDTVSTLFFVSCLAILYRKMRGVTEGKSKPQPLKLGIGFSFIKAHPRPAIFAILLLITVFSHLSALPLLYLSRGFEQKKLMMLMLAANTTTVVLTSFVQAQFLANRPHWKSAIYSCLLTAIGHALIPFSLNPMSIVVTTIIWSIGEALAYPLVTALVLEQFNKESAGLGVGVRDFIVKSSLVISPLVASNIPLTNNWSFALVYGCLPLAALVAFSFGTSVLSLNRQHFQISRRN